MNSLDVPSVLRDLEGALAHAWDAETCAPEDRARWTAENPARGQCITTVVVVHDFLGGELVRGEVQVDGVQTDYHWWNRLPDETEVDLTRGQFGPQEVIVGSETFPRPTGDHRVKGQYERLRERVLDALGPPGRLANSHVG